MRDANRTALALAATGLGAWLVVRAARNRHGFDFRGKTALVTGGSRGLGLVLARQLAAAGARIAICARDADELARAHDDLAGRGAHVLSIPCDVSDEGRVREMVAVVRQRLGPIDVLVNNAGTIAVGPWETMRVRDFQEAMANIFWPAVYTCQAVAPEMQARKQGRIVNVSSIGGKVAVPHLLPYCAGKFALGGFSEGLRAELAKDNVAVTTVYPGLMRTGSPRNADFKGQHRLEYNWFILGDSLPGSSMSAERAARQILAACRRGEAELVTTFPAKCATLLHGLFPGLTSDLMAVTNRLLPGPGGIGTRRLKGEDSETALSRSFLTSLTRRAAERNNEITPAEEETVEIITNATGG
jgi:NAD(P)-dependent dehydrogenase (short-subunit alcohol dehydrogenase family)